MAKKIEINENWEPVEVEDLDNLFVVIFKQGSFDQGYVEAFDTDDVLMQSAYDSLAKQYDDCGCDECTKIYLIKIPNTNQTVDMCNTGLFNGNCCDPHVIEATRDLFNRADCEQLSCWEGCGLTEAKKKKKVCSSATCALTDPILNIKHFNQCMGTGGLQNNSGGKSLIIGDTLPDAPATNSSSDAGSSDGASASAGEGGAMGESLKEELKLNKGHYDLLPGFVCELLDELIEKYGEEPWFEKFWEEYREHVIMTDMRRMKMPGFFLKKYLENNSELTESLNEAEEELVDITDLIKELKEPEEYWERHAQMKKDGRIFVNKSVADDLRAWGIKKGKITEDVEKELKIQNNENIEKDIEELNPPIDPEYFPNNMGINLSSVKKETWVQQDDGQLKTVTVEFDPATEEEKAEDGIEEGLNEVYLDYNTQLQKMKDCESGKRNTNTIPKMSDEKLEYNWRICKDHGLTNTLRLIEIEMRKRGGRLAELAAEKISISLSAAKLTLNDLQPADAKFVYEHLDDLDALINNAKQAPAQRVSEKAINVFKVYIFTILYAILMKRPDVANAIRDIILKEYKININELKQYINEILADTNLKQRLANCVNSALTEDLTEATGYSHRKEDIFNIPPQIKIINQKDVEDFITQLSPEEIFTIGYVTPIHFYAELENLFELVKATQFVGYTGIDYRDASTGTTADHADRVANAQRQIDTYKDGAEGHALNKEGEKFSTDYRQTNKLALNPKKDNEWDEYETELNADGKEVIKRDADGNPIVKQHIDLSKILFYPEIGSYPLVTYFLDLKDGKGFRKVGRKVIVDVLYKKVIELATYADKGFSEADLRYLKKQGIKVDDYIKQYGQMPVSAYKKAIESGIDPIKYREEHPWSIRWSAGDFRAKVNKMLDQDSKTIEASALEKDWGFNRNVTDKEQKPQVRALYTNQIYYLKGKPGTLGSQITEGLEEEVSLDEAKRYVKRYYVRPLNIFCGNKEDIIQALIRAGDQNCSVYSLKNLTDHEDVHLLQPSDIIYYWDDRVLYDKNHVQVMDYDLFVKHEEERKKVGNVDTMTDAAFSDMYDDRATEDDLKDKEVIANYKALNNITR